MSSSLLPVKEGDFAKKDYWDKFFKHRGNKAFEWYGDYTSNIDLYMKYVRTTDDILVVGCGNSDLSQHLYDLQKCHKIWNIDVSKVVIRQMISKCCANGARPGLWFKVADVCSLTHLLSSTADNKNDNENKDNNFFWPESFSVIVDKGTMDAMHSTEDATIPQQMLHELSQSLCKGGRYICITLAQPHIVDTLLQFFTIQCSGWIIRCQRLGSIQDTDNQFPLPVFAFVFTKLFVNNNSSSPPPAAAAGGAGEQTNKRANVVGIMEVFAQYNHNPTQAKFQRVNSVIEMKNWIQAQQNATMALHNMIQNGESSFILSHGSVDSPLFSCHVMQSKVVNKQKSSPYAVFIVPFGEEDLPAFATQENRKNLLQQTKCQRLLIVYLHPRWHFSTGKEEIENLLNETALAYAPPSLPANFRINYLSTPELYDWKIHKKFLQQNDEENLFILEKSPTKGRRLLLNNRKNHSFLNGNLKGLSEQLCCGIIDAVVASLSIEASSILFCCLPSSLEYFSSFKVAVDYFTPSNHFLCDFLTGNRSDVLAFFNEHPPFNIVASCDTLSCKSYQLIFVDLNNATSSVCLTQLASLCDRLDENGLLCLACCDEESKVLQHLSSDCFVLKSWSIQELPSLKQWFEVDQQRVYVIVRKNGNIKIQMLLKEMEKSQRVNWNVLESITNDLKNLIV